MRQWGWEDAPSPPEISNGVKIAGSAYDNWFVVVKSDKTVASWGEYAGGSPPNVDGLSHVIDVSAGEHHGLVLKDDGTVEAFGDDYGNGELDVPSGLDHVVQVHAGSAGSYAVKDDGTVVAWGYTFTDEESVAALTNVKEISSGQGFVMAVKNDGTVQKLGGSDIVVSDLTNIVHVSAAFRGVMFITGTGDVILRGNRGLFGTWPSNPTGLGGVKKGSLGVYNPTVIYENTPTIALTTRDFVGGNGLTHLYADLSLERTAPTDTVFDITSTDGSVASQSVTIPAGETSVRADLQPDSVSSNRIVKVTATSSIGTSTSRFTNRAIAVESVSINAPIVTGGEMVQVTVTLNSTLNRDVTVKLLSSESAVDFTSQVNVVSPARSFTIDVPTSLVPSIKKAKLSAQIASTTPAYTFLVLNPALAVKSIAFGMSIFGNQKITGTVYTNYPAPGGGGGIALTTNIEGVSVPVTLQVAAGSRSVDFEITGDDVSWLTAVTISAAAAGVPVSRIISVKPNDVGAFALTSTSIKGGDETEATVTLRAAVSRNTVVQLSSPSAAVSVPASVTILAGSKTATFRVRSSAVTKTTNIKLAASRAGLTRYVNLTLTKG